MASLTLTLNCTVLEAGTSQIVATVSDGVDIPDELLIFSRGVTADKDAYKGIASPYEVVTYPAGRDADYAFYRLATATVGYPTAAAGAAAKASFVVQMQAILDAYEEVAGFVGVAANELESA